MAHVNPNAAQLLDYRLEGPLAVAGDNSFYAPHGIAGIYIQTGLDAPELAEHIREPRHRIVIVLGTPGDGKTRFLRRFEGTLDARGVPYSVRHDAAFAAGLDKDAEIAETRALLKDSALDEADLDHDAWLERRKPVVLLGINRGLYDVVFRNRNQPYNWLHTHSDAALVLDLARRFPFGGLQARDIFADLVREVTDRRLWEDWKSAEPGSPEGCGTCPARGQCPILWNIRMLREESVVDRLRYELSRIVLTGEHRATLRELWDYIAHITVVHPDAYVRDHARYHPCDWIQTDLRSIDDIADPDQRNMRIVIGFWRLLPNLAWSAGDAIELLRGTPSFQTVAAHTQSGSPRVSGIAAGLVGQMALRDPTSSATALRRELEMKASVDPLGTLEHLEAWRPTQVPDTADHQQRFARAISSLMDKQSEHDPVQRLVTVALDYLIRRDSLALGPSDDRALSRFYGLIAYLILLDPAQESRREEVAAGVAHHADLLMPGAGWKSGNPSRQQLILRQVRDDALVAIARTLGISDHVAVAPMNKGAGAGLQVQELRLARSSDVDRSAGVAIALSVSKLAVLLPALPAGTTANDAFVDAMPTSLLLEIEVEGTEQPIHMPIDLTVLDFVESVSGEGRQIHPGRSGLASVDSFDVFKGRLRAAAARQRLRVGDYVLMMDNDTLTVDEAAQ